MNIVRIPTPPQGNLRYPLPADYDELTTDGQRLARVNACRQWLLTGTEDERAEARVASLHFFDKYYLWPDPDNNFDPYFYDDVPAESPDLHWDLVRDFATFALNTETLPRGAAKSTLVRKDIALVTISRPAYSTVYATSSHDNAKMTGQILRDTCYDNPRVLEDWSPEYGRLKPVRGESPTGVEFFYLENNSWIRCVSIESKLRGLRPRRFRLDDPEYDPKASTSMILIRQYMEEAIFKVILPMVMRGNCGCDWLNTFVSKRHYAYSVMEQVLGPDGILRAKDARFGFWNRRVVRAEYDIPSTIDPAVTRRVSFWPDMYPLTRADALAIVTANPTRARPRSLEEIREMIGASNYNSEYLASPGDDGTQFFPTPEPTKHGWEWDTTDASTAEEPWKSAGTIKWTDKDGKTQLQAATDFIRSHRLFLTADTSYTQNATSDYKVATVMAINYQTNLLFVLDMWSGQCSENELVRQILKLAYKWRVPTLHPELVRESISLYEGLDNAIRTKMHHEMGMTDWAPGVQKDNKPGNDNKEAKIASLQFRFDTGLIKLPLWRTDPPFQRLWDQILEYNPSVEGGGVPHDDELDTIAMSRKIIRGRHSSQPIDVPRTETFEEMRARGVTDYKGLKIGLGINWDKADPALINQLLSEADTHDNRKPGDSLA